MYTMHTPLKQARIRRSLTVRDVAEAVGCDASNLIRLENDPWRRPKRELARSLYVFYRGELNAIDLYDHTFLDEVGLIEPARNGGGASYRIRTRERDYKADSASRVRSVLDRLGLLKIWDGFSL